MPYLTGEKLSDRPAFIYLAPYRPKRESVAAEAVLSHPGVQRRLARFDCVWEIGGPCPWSDLAPTLKIVKRDLAGKADLVWYSYVRAPRSRDLIAALDEARSTR